MNNIHEQSNSQLKQFKFATYINLSNHDAQKQARDPQTLTVHIVHTAISTTRSHHGRTWYVHVPCSVLRSRGEFPFNFFCVDKSL